MEHDIGVGQDPAAGRAADWPMSRGEKVRRIFHCYEQELLLWRPPPEPEQELPSASEWLPFADDRDAADDAGGDCSEGGRRTPLAP